MPAARECGKIPFANKAGAPVTSRTHWPAPPANTGCEGSEIFLVKYSILENGWTDARLLCVKLPQAIARKHSPSVQAAFIIPQADALVKHVTYAIRMFA